MYRNRILSKEDSELYVHWQFNICGGLSLPSALIFQATPLPEMSVHRKEMNKSHILQNEE